MTGITLTGNVLLSTGAVGAGDITLATVTGTTAGAEDLTLLAGTGNIMAGAIGATRLDDLQVTSANNATFNSVTADTFTQLAGTGTTTFNGTQNYTGDFAFTGNALTINQPLSAVAMTVTNAGLFTTAAAGDITLTGPFLQNGAGASSLAGDITTADQNITFMTGITLTGNVLLSTGAVGAGDITLATVTGTTAGVEDLTLLAGTGDILLLGAVGAPVALGQVTASGAAITTASVTTTGDQSYTGTVSVTNSGVLSSTTGNITIIGGEVNQNDNITTGGAGMVTVTATGTNITMALGATTTTNTGPINYLADDNVVLGLLTSTAGPISVTATTGAITDANGSALNIDGPNVSLVANTAIGTITAFGVAELDPTPDPDMDPNSNGAGNAIEIDVDTLTLAQTMAAGSTIHLIQDDNLTLGANSVIVAGGLTGQAIIHATGDFNASLATAISLTAGDDLALISGGTLSIPAAGTGFNVGAGDLRMIGDTDVVAAGGALTFTSNRLYFRSGGAGGDATLDTNVARIIAHLDTNDLTVNEANDIQLNSVTTGAGNITVNTAGVGNIAVGLVDADTSNVTLNSAGNITSVAPDGTADVRGSIINLTAAVGGIGNVGAAVDVTVVPNAIVDEALNANTADNSDIFIDSIGDLPVGLVTAGAGLGAGDVTLNSTGNITSVTPNGTADVSGSIINLDANSGGIGTGPAHLDVDADTALNADTTTDNSGIFIDSIGNLPVGLVTAGIGNVTLESTGNVTSVAPNAVADVVGSTINLVAAVGGIGAAGAGLDVEITLSPIVVEQLNASTTADNSNVFLDSIANLPVGLVNAGTGDVTIDSLGNIVDFAADAVTNIAADDLLLTTAVTQGIGVAGNPIDTAVNDFEGVAGSGGLFLTDQDALEIGDFGATVGATAAGAVDIRTLADDLIVSESVASSGQSVRVEGRDDLQINATVTGNTDVTGIAVDNNLTAAQAVTAVTGSAMLTAGNDANLNAAVTGNQNVTGMAGNDLTNTQAVTATVGSVSLTAGNDANLNGAVTGGQNVTGMAGRNLTTTQAVTASAGSATLNAVNDASLNATVTAGQNVSSNAGNNLTTMQAVTATAGSATLNAGNDANLNGTVLAGQNVTGTAGANLTTTQTVTATAGSATLNATSGDATLNAAVTAGTNVSSTAGSDVNFNGIITAGQNVSGTAGDNVTTTQAVTATAGSATLNATSGDATLNAAVTAGTNVSSTAGSDVNFNGTITAGQNVSGTAGDNLTTTQAVTATAGSATLDAGNDATLNAAVTAGQNVVGTADNNLTTMQAVTATAGSATLNAGNDANLNGTVLAGQNVTGTAGANLTTTQTVTATAGSATLNATSGDATLNAAVTAGTNVSSTAGSDVNFNGTITAGQNVTGTAGGNIGTTQAITSMAGSVDLDAGNTVNIAANVTANSGNIMVEAGANSPDAILLNPASILDSSGGQISGEALVRDGTTGEFTAIDNSINTGAPIVGISGTGEIQVEVVDSNGQNFTITIDWLEGINTNALTNRIVDSLIDGTPPPANVLTFQHQFNSVPEETTPGGFVPVPVRISNFAGGTIQLTINNINLLDLPNGTQGQQGIETTVFVPFAGSGIVTILPLPEPLPQAPDAPPTILASFEFESQPVERNSTTFIESSTGGVVRGETRYYELRIVSFDEEGNLVETPEGRINLNDADLKAIAPFDPSKLPALFGRLPADRYRIYLIEDGTERLILDFIIQQGQPIEVPETFEGDVEEGPAAPMDGAGAVRELFDTDQLAQPSEADFGWALPDAVRGNGGQCPPYNFEDGLRLSREPAWSRLQTAESFAERFGEASFLSHGGIMVGAAALAAASSGRWEKKMDRVMEQFGRRRPFTRRRAVTRQIHGAGDHAPQASLSLKD
jgi:hypothetical protein